MTLGGLLRFMSEQELDPVQFSAGGMAQLRTRAAKIVWRQSDQAEFGGVLFHYVPRRSRLRGAALTERARSAPVPCFTSARHRRTTLQVHRMAQRTGHLPYVCGCTSPGSPYLNWK